MLESNQMKISVIIPVYKVECYLDKCIESVVNQTYKNLEISFLPFLNAKRDVGFIDKPLYNYRLNEAGTSLSKNPARAYHLFKAFYFHLEYAKKYSFEDAELVLYKTVTHGMGVIHNKIRNLSWKNDKEEIDEVRYFMGLNKG